MKEDSSPEKCDSVLEGYRSAVDGPAAIVASSLLTAYPHAKFILVSKSYDVVCFSTDHSHW